MRKIHMSNFCILFNREKQKIPEDKANQMCSVAYYLFPQCKVVGGVEDVSLH